MRKLFKFNPITQKRIAKFKRQRRGYLALWLLAIAYLISLGSEFVVGNQPLFVSYQGHWYFPALMSHPVPRFFGFQRYYPETLFGGQFDLEADFRELAKSDEFRAAGGHILMPLQPFSPLESVLVPGDPPPAHPSWRHPMGTDDRGRDILARLIHGFRISLSFALVLTTLSFAIGVTIGAIQGYWGGWVDLTFQRIEEIWAALPFLYVVILISSIITPNFWLLIAILLLFQWIGISRYMRGEVLRERSRDYVTAARALGASTPRIMFGHILGNAMTPVVTLYPFSLAGAIFALSSLDFLGFGLPAPTPSWGELFQQGRGQINQYWLITSPFGALFWTLLLTTFVGEAVRDAWDPKEYHRRQD